MATPAPHAFKLLLAVFTHDCRFSGLALHPHYLYLVARLGRLRPGYTFLTSNLVSLPGSVLGELLVAVGTLESSDVQVDCGVVVLEDFFAAGTTE